MKVSRLPVREDPAKAHLPDKQKPRKVIQNCQNSVCLARSSCRRIAFVSAVSPALIPASDPAPGTIAVSLLWAGGVWVFTASATRIAAGGIRNKLPQEKFCLPGSIPSVSDPSFLSFCRIMQTDCYPQDFTPLHTQPQEVYQFPLYGQEECGFSFPFAAAPPLMDSRAASIKADLFALKYSSLSSLLLFLSSSSIFCSIFSLLFCHFGYGSARDVCCKRETSRTLFTDYTNQYLACHVFLFSASSAKISASEIRTSVRPFVKKRSLPLHDPCKCVRICLP